MALQLRNKDLLKPMVALAGWTFIMETWMYTTRLPAIAKYQVRTDPAYVSEDMKTKIPISVRQVADNFNHLHEQPQVFYAVSLALTMLGDTHPYTRFAAWGYVGVRIAHSLCQAISNYIPVRFRLFVTSSMVLLGLTGRLAQLVF